MSSWGAAPLCVPSHVRVSKDTWTCTLCDCPWSENHDEGRKHQRNVYWQRFEAQYLEQQRLEAEGAEETAAEEAAGPQLATAQVATTEVASAEVAHAPPSSHGEDAPHMFQAIDDLHERMSDISERITKIENILLKTIDAFRKDLKYIVDHITNINERPDGGFVLVPTVAP